MGHLPFAATISRHRHFCQGHRPAPKSVMPINHHKRFLAKGLFQIHGLGHFHDLWGLSKTSLPLVFSKTTSSHPLLVFFKTTSYSWDFSKTSSAGVRTGFSLDPFLPKGILYAGSFSKDFCFLEGGLQHSQPSLLQSLLAPWPWQVADGSDGLPC